MAGCKPFVQEESIVEVIERVMDVAQPQLLSMSDYLADKDERLPRSYDKELDTIITSNSRWWCSGFFSGTLWYLYEYNKKDAVLRMAKKYLMRVENEKFNTYDHDIGFQIYCSFGNAYRFTGDEEYKKVLITAANSATKRYNESIGLIRSWDHHRDKWQYPVIIDNMMNLELLMWAFQATGDSLYYDVAINHADNTLLNHFRPDYSLYHVVSYDTITHQPEIKQTFQGAFDESIWARGQAWGLYSYTMMYRKTGYQRYLDQAIGIAEMLIGHPNMPEDMIPYWDLLAPKIPDELRDASAAAIMASALIELSGFVNNQKKKDYLNIAETQIRTLSTSEYLAEPGTNGYFLLKRGVGHLPGNSEIDVPLTYADYYFIEALLRFKALL